MRRKKYPSSFKYQTFFLQSYSESKNTQIMQQYNSLVICGRSYCMNDDTCFIEKYDLNGVTGWHQQSEHQDILTGFGKK